MACFAFGIILGKNQQLEHPYLKFNKKSEGENEK